MGKKYFLLLSLVILVGAILMTFQFYEDSEGWSSRSIRPSEVVSGPTFNHQLHTKELGLDCRYCHTGIQQKSPRAGLPSVESCMGCHAYVGKDIEKLESLRQSYLTESPISWKISNHLPDHAHFHHGKHIQAGLKCQTCHGNVQTKSQDLGLERPLDMQWCISCHNNPHVAVDYSLNIKKQGPTKTTKMRDCQTCHH